MTRSRIASGKRCGYYCCTNRLRRYCIVPIDSVIRNFQCTKQHILDLCVDSASNILEWFVYAIGPLLIVLALGIVSLLAYTFFGILVPMIYHKHEHQPMSIQWSILLFHCSTVLILLLNVLYNYACCVVQSHTGHHYDTVIHELAALTNIQVPNNPHELQLYRRQLSQTLTIRMKEQQQKQQQHQLQLDQPTTVVESNTSHNNNNSSNGEVTQRRTVNAISSDKANTSRMNHHHNHHDPLLGDTLSITTSTVAMTEPVPTVVKHPQPPVSLPLIQQQLLHVPPPVPPPPSPMIRTWMVLGPYEWGYCSQTQQIKPPRSHYDHVTSKLILNLDHYCPWMFNAVGYFNYRYFVNFLLFTFIGMFYGALMMLEPFLLLKSPDYRHQNNMLFQQHQRNILQEGTANVSRTIRRQILHQQRIQPMMPYRDEKLYLTLSFMLCVAVGIALIGLGGFHVYLVSTGQTTIEFHGNWALRRRYEQIANVASNGKKKSKWQNPYSRGTILSNWQQVYGVSTMTVLKWIGCGCSDRSYINLLVCILVPNRNLPEYLPVPIPGENTLRRIHHVAITKTPNTDNVDGNNIQCHGLV